MYSLKGPTLNKKNPSWSVLHHIGKFGLQILLTYFGLNDFFNYSKCKKVKINIKTIISSICRVNIFLLQSILESTSTTIHLFYMMNNFITKELLHKEITQLELTI